MWGPILCHFVLTKQTRNYHMAVSHLLLCTGWAPHLSFGGLLEGLQKLKCGAHPVQVPINETNEKLPHGSLSFVELHGLEPTSKPNKNLKGLLKIIEYLLKVFSRPCSTVGPILV